MAAMFEVKRKTSLDEIYQQIQEELRSQYSIGYRSDGDPTASGFSDDQAHPEKKGCQRSDSQRLLCEAVLVRTHHAGGEQDC